MPINAPNTRNPGVKIAEVQLVGPPILGVATNVAGFVGTAPNTTRTEFKDKAHLVTSLDQFLQEYVADKVDPNNPKPDDPLHIPANLKSTALSIAVAGFFQNGGQQCWVVNTADIKAGLKELEAIDDVSIVAAPGANQLADYSELQKHVETLKDRVAILDPPAGVADHGKLIKTMATGGDGLRPPSSIYEAFYYPQIKITPALKGDGDPKVPLDAFPSGHIAGLYASVDPHRAPANLRIRGALGVVENITDAAQNALNPKGVNAIRLFTEGPTVFGARTIQDEGAPTDALFLYISTRRLTNFVQESLQNGLRFAVFEPNTIPLRQRIARSARAFLDGVWRDGALFGAKADDAYYVRFPDAFNTDDDRAKGRLTIEIGIRVAFPAEFIIIRIGLILQAPN
jgi:uncharacterized protein